MAEQAKERKIHIELTAEQKAQLKRLVGKEASALELTAEELEERIAPAGTPGAGGHVFQ